MNATIPDATGSAPSHVELLHLVRDIQAAEVSSDPGELTAAAQRLRTQLERHLEAERQDHDLLPADVRRALRSGQQRLLTLVDGIGGGSCRENDRPCIVRVAELAALLRRQARMEVRAARRR